jgi:hypothetical protein
MAWQLTVQTCEPQQSDGEVLVMSGKVFVAGENVTPEYMAYLSSTLR